MMEGRSPSMIGGNNNSNKFFTNALKHNAINNMLQGTLFQDATPMEFEDGSPAQSIIKNRKKNQTVKNNLKLSRFDSDPKFELHI